MPNVHFRSKPEVENDKVEGFYPGKAPAPLANIRLGYKSIIKHAA